jgi:hypothetical protein
MTLELPYELIAPISYTSYSWEVNGSSDCLTKEQLTQLNDWLKDVYSRAAKKQYLEKKASGHHRLPYYGASGGGVTFSISGTALGNVVEVTEHISGETINLTDYGSW